MCHHSRPVFHFSLNTFHSLPSTSFSSLLNPLMFLTHTTRLRSSQGDKEWQDLLAWLKNMIRIKGASSSTARRFFSVTQTRILNQRSSALFIVLIQGQTGIYNYPRKSQESVSSSLCYEPSFLYRLMLSVIMYEAMIMFSVHLPRALLQGTRIWDAEI